MTNCPHCKSEVQPGWKACPSCGERLPEMPICNSCGAELQWGGKACPACGNQVESDQGPSLDTTDSAAEEVHQSQAVDRTIREGHQAAHMVSFPRAIKLGFQNYFNFRGRATRAEYWWWQLFATVVSVALLAIIGLQETLLAEALFLPLVLPTLSLNTRRLHDINLSGWLQVICWWWFGFQAGYEGANNYGPAPHHPVD